MPPIKRRQETAPRGQASTGQSYWDLLEGPLPKSSGTFSIRGPWHINDPVHETITREALVRAGLLDAQTAYSSPEAWEYVRGVVWNDDPEGLLFQNNARRTDLFSTGVTWFLRFKEAEKRAGAGEVPGPNRPLTARSHFGDLQFIHGMASRDGEPAGETLAAMLDWAQFVYALATGALSPGCRIADATPQRIRLLFSKPGGTVDRLFCCTGPADITRRAAGSLLHIIQDSFASGHVEREAGTWRIRSFHSYAHQDHAKHAADDGWRGGNTDAERLSRVKGAPEAVERCAGVLRLLHARAPWADVRAFLLQQVWVVIDPATPAGPGPYQH